MATTYIDPVRALTVGGNSPTENAILSIAEAQVRGVLNNDMNTMFFRTSAIADQIATLNGIGTAIFRIAERITWGSDYDTITGAVNQWTSAVSTTVYMDQKLTLKWRVEEFDMERFLASDPNVRATLIAEWSSSMIKSYLFAMEAIFLTGVKDYCIAKSQVLPINLINLTKESALDAYYNIGEKNNNLIKKVTKAEVGVNASDIKGAIGFTSYLQMTKIFQEISYATVIPAETVVTGKLYRDSIFGTDLMKSFYLEQIFSHGTETGLHLQKTFDLRKMFGAFIHKNAVAMPTSFQSIRQVIDNETGNLKWICKALYAIPTMIRGHLQYIIQANMPTNEEITTAQNLEYSKVQDKSNATYKIADFDSFLIDLDNLIFIKNLGVIDSAGDIPTVEELETAIKAKNQSYITGHIDATEITATSATITAKEKDTLYKGIISIIYTIKKKQNNQYLELIQKENDINLENKKLIEKITKLEKENEKWKIKKEEEIKPKPEIKEEKENK